MMTQPGGTTCGLPARYRTYLCCSPLVCAADTFATLTRLAILVFYVHLPTREAVSVVLHERFNDKARRDEETLVNARLRHPYNQFDRASVRAERSSEDDIEVLKTLTFLRWIWFILGTLPPAIKLMAMRGVPWTQTWGIIFLISWSMNEYLISSATFHPAAFTISPSGRISWTGFEDTSRSVRYKKATSMMNWLERRLAILALVVHSVLVNAAFRDLWRITPMGFNHTHQPLRLLRLLDTLSLSGFLLLLVAIFSLVVAPSPRKHQAYLALLSTIFLFLLGLGGSGITRARDPFHRTSPVVKLPLYLFRGSALAVCYINSTLSLSIQLFLPIAARHSLMLGRNLLVLRSARSEGDQAIDHIAVLTLLYFWSTALATVLWYCFVYNPIGTFNPTWTRVFG